MPKTRRQQVYDRARECCEYCQIPLAYDPRPFHIDHIRPRKHGGSTALQNLAACCAACSLAKGPNAAGFDPATDTLQRLFNPRIDRWPDHFEWMGAKLLGKSEIGRATIYVLRINDHLRVEHRRFLIELGTFPPASDKIA